MYQEKSGNPVVEGVGGISNFLFVAVLIVAHLHSMETST
jgi:hypothetical protein